jgi:Tfp pilus assembly protein PilF
VSPPSRHRRPASRVRTPPRRAAPRLLALGLGLALAAAAGAAAAALDPAPAPLAAPFVAPYLPASDALRLQEVPSRADPAVAAIATLRARLDAAPGTLDAALALAGAYVDYGRQVGDAHYAGYAEAVLAPWLARSAPPAAVLVVEATILQYRHQFDAARTRLARALAAEPANVQAWLTLATLDLVQGDYRAARRSCARLTASGGPDLGLACLASLASDTGHARQSLALLEQAAAAGAHAAPAYLAWVHGLWAEAAERLGDAPLAEAHYRAALARLPRDNFLLVAYADFLLDHGRAREVLPLLADHAQSDTAFLRLALAHAALGSADAPRYAWIMGARFEALAQRGSEFFGREEARFALELQHDPARALDLAERNWRVQREPWDARVLLAAAQAARAPGRARAALEFLASTGLEDPRVAALARALGSEPGREAGGGR